jgi:glutamate-1-semialdehyde aminotransferase
VKGAYAWDVDGNKYIDYVGSWGPAIVGHADDEVLKVLGEVAAKGRCVCVCVCVCVCLCLCLCVCVCV